MRTFRNHGFTLIEMMVGIAATSLLLVAVFQFAAKLITFRETVYRTGQKTHRKVVLNQLLHQDLTAIPRGEANFEASRDRFTRRTVTYDSEKGRLMETIVQYVIRHEEGEDRLYRRWRWAELQDEYRNVDRLIRADRIEILYRDGSGHWQTRPGRTRPGAIKISLGESALVTQLAGEKRKR